MTGRGIYSWDDQASNFEPLDLANLPRYCLIYVFKNLDRFRATFCLLSMVRVVSALLGFLKTYLIAAVLTEITTLEVNQVLYWYLPLLCATTILIEILDFFIRKYFEPFPAVFCDYSAFKFFKTILLLRHPRLFSYSKERLVILVNKYNEGVKDFLRDWIWRIPGEVVNLVLVGLILYFQSPKVLAFNLVLMLGYFLLAFKLSAKISILARTQSEAQVAAGGLISSMTQNLGSVSKLMIGDFFDQVYKRESQSVWNHSYRVADFHAKRWFLQLNLFNFVYIGTMVYGVIQVINHQLPVGFLLLIKWAYDALWQIMQFAIEYYVALVSQREANTIIRSELVSLVNCGADLSQVRRTQWKTIALRDVRVIYRGENVEQKVISIPNFRLSQGEHVLITGESGTGKTTLLNVLIESCEYQGEYLIDSKPILAGQGNLCASLIDSSAPVFTLTVLDNIVCGRPVSQDRLNQILTGTLINEFCPDLLAIFGDPSFNVSSGQLQRIRIARGLIPNSQIYLLDEPFNGLDSVTKQRVIEFMAEHLRSKTVILVSHLAQDSEVLTDMTRYSMRGGQLTPI